MGVSHRPGWHRPVLGLALLLVVAQVIAFIAIKASKPRVEREPATVAATVPPVVLAPVVDAAAEPAPQAPAAAIVPVDAPPPVDAAAPDARQPEKLATTTPAPKQTRAELLAQQKKLQKEREANDAKLRDAKQREDERQAQERKRIEQERMAAETARAEEERQRAARTKAEQEAAARAEEQARRDAEAKAKKQAVTPAPAKPDVLVLVFGPGTPSASHDQIRGVYLGQTSVWPNGTAARPINRPLSTTAARKFYGGVLRTSADQFADTWNTLQLSGGGIKPPTVASGKAAVAKVASTRGGFTYAMESELPADISGVRLVRLQ